MSDGQPTIVIVDDDDDFRMLVQTRLRLSHAFDVVAGGADGAEAVSLAREHQPSILLLDVSMPGMGGIEALPLVCAASPDTQVVMYSGFRDRGLAEHTLALGASAFLEKSTSLGTLADDLLDVLSLNGQPEPPGPAPSAVRSPSPGRKRAQRQLRQTETSIRLLVDAVEDYAIFMVDPDGYVMTWNAGAQRSKGYSAAEIVGEHFRAFYPAEQQAEGHPEHELDIALKEGHFEEDAWRVRKDGTRFWANVVVTAVFDAGGEHIGFAMVTRDTSERKFVLDDQEQTARALAEVNEQLEIANQRLTRVADERAHFLAVTAHELRSPVGLLGLSAQTLDAHWEQLTELERRKMLGGMVSGAAQLRRLLEDLLTAARVESSALELYICPLRLLDMLTDVVASARQVSGEAEILVEGDPAVKVLADRGRLAQAVDNLLANALTHGEPPVRVEIRRLEAVAEIAVQDAGKGVAADIRPRLFSQYATGRKGGTGLGLFIVRELARAQHGDAVYRPGASPGSPGEFVISLPLAPADQDSAD